MSPAVSLVQLIRSCQLNVAQVLQAPEELVQLLHVRRLYAGLEDLEVVLPAINASFSSNSFLLSYALSSGSASVSVGSHTPSHVTQFLSRSPPARRARQTASPASPAPRRAGGAAWLLKTWSLCVRALGRVWSSQTCCQKQCGCVRAPWARIDGSKFARPSGWTSFVF